jgi:hypothetical protein
MQALLIGARLLDRMDLRPQVIGAQKIVGDPQPAGRVSLEEIKPAIAPKIRQGR